MTLADAVAELRAPVWPTWKRAAIDTVLDVLDQALDALDVHEATVTTGGPPPGYHLPGEWTAPAGIHTPPDSALDGPPTPTRKAAP